MLRCDLNRLAMKPSDDAPMRNRALEPDPEWIVPDRVYAPGHEPRQTPPDARRPEDWNILGDDLWRGAAVLLLILLSVAAIASVVI